MDKYSKLDTIANSLIAVNKINSIRYNLQKAVSHGSSESLSRQGRAPSLDKITTLNEVLRVLAQHSPEPYRRQFGEIASKSSMYTGVYTNLVKHFERSRNRQFDRYNIIKTLDIVKPLADNRGKILIDKILKLYEVCFL